MGSDALAQVLRPLAERFPSASHPDVLVGLHGPDDAAVFRLSPEMAVVATTDFFPPVVDDPYAFGSIAAANAMSDVFAMGGDVLLALNLAVIPADFPPAVTAAIIAGGADKVSEAGGVLVGGHTVLGNEPMYGLAVVGRAHPERLLRKVGARPGDRLVLTKPLGSGLITTALKGGRADSAHVAAAMDVMAALNRSAGHGALAAGACSATDITGFGLIGHALEMADASGVCFVIDVAALPVLDGALSYARSGAAPGGTARNRAAAEGRVTGLAGLPPEWVDLVFDPQTSGGLLVALAPAAVGGYIRALEAAGALGVVIGRVETGGGIALLRSDGAARRSASAGAPA